MTFDLMAHLSARQEMDLVTRDVVYQTHKPHRAGLDAYDLFFPEGENNDHLNSDVFRKIWDPYCKLSNHKSSTLEFRPAG